MRCMDRELTLPQAREIVRLRRRHSGSELVVHRREYGLIAEVRRGARVVELERFDWTGEVVPDRNMGTRGRKLPARVSTDDVT